MIKVALMHRAEAAAFVRMLLAAISTMDLSALRDLDVRGKVHRPVSWSSETLAMLCKPSRSQQVPFPHHKDKLSLSNNGVCGGYLRSKDEEVE